jgi:hypothetical protein
MGQILEWGEAHGSLSRSEAIRRLVELGLTVRRDRPRVLSTSKQSAARAAEMAGDVIDEQSDPDASDTERKDRKRSLLDGPSGFQKNTRDKPAK